MTRLRFTLILCVVAMSAGVMGQMLLTQPLTYTEQVTGVPTKYTLRGPIGSHLIPVTNGNFGATSSNQYWTLGANWSIESSGGAGCTARVYGANSGTLQYTNDTLNVIPGQTYRVTYSVLAITGTVQAVLGGKPAITNGSTGIATNWITCGPDTRRWLEFNVNTDATAYVDMDDITLRRQDNVQTTCIRWDNVGGASGTNDVYIHFSPDTNALIENVAFGSAYYLKAGDDVTFPVLLDSRLYGVWCWQCESAKTSAVNVTAY